MRTNVYAHQCRHRVQRADGTMSPCERRMHNCACAWTRLVRATMVCSCPIWLRIRKLFLIAAPVCGPRKLAYCCA